jgi:hypothetical protein
VRRGEVKVGSRGHLAGVMNVEGVQALPCLQYLLGHDVDICSHPLRASARLRGRGGEERRKEGREGGREGGREEGRGFAG